MALISDTWTLFRREMLRYARDRAYWIGQLVFPVAIVGFVGFGLDEVVELPSGVAFVAHLSTGMLALIVGSGAVGGGFSLIEDRESGFLRTLLVAPVSRASILLGKLAARVVVSLLLVAMLIATLIVLAAFAQKHARRTRLGDEVLERLRDDKAALALTRRSALHQPTGTDAAWAVALWSAAIVAAPAPDK